MARILYIKVSDSAKRVKLGVEDGAETVSLVLSDVAYSDFGFPEREDEIDEYTLSEMKAEDEKYRALRKAMGYLALSDRSRLALIMRLKQSGFSSHAAEYATDECIRLGYLDEDRQLSRLVETEANYRLRGRYYIKRKLAAKGYSVSHIDRALALLVERGDIDFDSNFERLAEKRGALSDDDREALKYRFGYKI